LAGAVAEHGAWLYDAISRQGRIVISDESMFQLERMRERLQNTPGVFMDERHRYSIRAFTYREKPPGLIRTLADSARFSPVGDGALAPVSTQLVHHLLEDMRLDRLGFHHTSIDTAIIAKETDKGRGLLALRDWVLGPDCATIAVGDGDADLDMFAVATHSFGPASLSSWNQARLLGCQRASSSGQKALLEIVDRVLHAGQDDCPVCKGSLCGQDAEHDLFYRLLRVADQKPLRRLLAAVSNRSAYEALIR
jgi:hypothetical protein